MGAKFYTVNAFTDTFFQGAPVLVFPDADSFSTKDMHDIAQEFSFNETVFCVAPSDTKYASRFRIFTPSGEIPFAGHPTIAAAYVLAHIGNIAVDTETQEVLIEETIGDIQLHLHRHLQGYVDLTEFAVKVSPQTDSYVPNNKELAEFLQIEPTDIGLQDYKPLVVITDRAYLMVPLADHLVVKQAKFSLSSWIKSQVTTTIQANLLLFCSGSMVPDEAFYARLVGKGIAEHEDPPVGSAVPALASYLCNFEQWKKNDNEFVVRRGAGKRLSTLNVSFTCHESQMTVRVGGSVVIVSKGELLL